MKTTVIPIVDSDHAHHAHHHGHEHDHEHAHKDGHEHRAA